MQKAPFKPLCITFILHSNMTHDFVTINKAFFKRCQICNEQRLDRRLHFLMCFDRITLAFTTWQEIIQQHITLQLLFWSCYFKIINALLLLIIHYFLSSHLSNNQWNASFLNGRQGRFYCIVCDIYHVEEHSLACK